MLTFRLFVFHPHQVDSCCLLSYQNCSKWVLLCLVEFGWSFLRLFEYFLYLVFVIFVIDQYSFSLRICVCFLIF